MFIILLFVAILVTNLTHHVSFGYAVLDAVLWTLIVSFLFGILFWVLALLGIGGKHAFLGYQDYSGTGGIVNMDNIKEKFMSVLGILGGILVVLLWLGYFIYLPLHEARSYSCPKGDSVVINFFAVPLVQPAVYCSSN